MMARPLLGSLALLSLVALPSGAAAHDIDRIEHTFGATHVSAQTANGGLSVAVAPRGEITVLSWPSPTFYDQLDYETSNDEDAREQPFFGAGADQGLFAGILVETEDGESQFLWLRDEAFDVEQRYLTEISGAILQQSVHPSLGLSVQETLFVDRSRDVLARRARVKRAEDSPVTSVRYVLYENLAPTASKPDDLAEAPLFGQDDGHDFAAFWDSDRQAVVHFAPRGEARDEAALADLMAGTWGVGDTWEALGLPQVRDLLDGPLGEGVFLALGGVQAPSAFQIGWQSDRPCTQPAPWTWEPTSAFEDSLDGELEGSPVAGCHVNAALAWDLDFGPTGTLQERDAETLLALGESSSEALDLLDLARAESFDTALQRSDEAWAEWVGGLRVPEGLDDEVIHFSRRALISLQQGIDREASATVASLATQPSYHHDWPRDSAFFNLALDVAGNFDEVTRHQAFLASVQNREPVWGGSEDAPFMVSPPGAWFMNFYADGQESTDFLNTFEIDQVGLALWSFWAHGTFAPNENVQRDVVAASWSSIELGARLLAACVDDDHPALAGSEVEAGYPSWWPAYEQLSDGTVPDAEARWAAMAAGSWESLRPCAANEDDNPVSTVSLYSTHVTRLGLLAAVRAAELLCIESDEVTYWKERADELGAVAFSLYWDPQAETWEGRGDWILWPEPLSIDPSLDPLFSDADSPGAQRTEIEAFERAALEAYAATVHAEVSDAVSLQTEGAAYENKKTLSLARWWTGDRLPEGDELAENEEHIRAMAADLPTAGTRHVGEVWVSIDDDGDGIYDRAEQRVAVPHLWSASLTYLSAMAVSQPELFEPVEGDIVTPVCISGEEPLDTRDVKPCSDGCQESYTGRPNPSGTSLLLLLALLLRRPRRRQPAKG